MSDKDNRLDLVGDDAGGDAGDEPRGSGGEGGRKKSGDKPGARTQRRHDAALRSRLESTLERIVEWLEGRGDLELAGVIREDSRAMIGGLVSLTRPLEWLRPPIVAVLSVVEPLLAFGRVGRVLAGRMADRRAQRAADERELAGDEAGAGEQDTPPEPPPY